MDKEDAEEANKGHWGILTALVVTCYRKQLSVKASPVCLIDPIHEVCHREDLVFS
jgi:hypothetical protein